MNNPLNELSAVYQNNIAEGDCGCDHKKDDEKKGKMKVKPEMLPQGKSPMGGDGAKPGKDKNYVKPMDEGYDKPDEKLKTDRDGYRVSKKDADAAKERLLAKAKAKREMKEEEIQEALPAIIPALGAGALKLGSVALKGMALGSKVAAKGALKGAKVAGKAAVRGAAAVPRSGNNNDQEEQYEATNFKDRDKILKKAKPLHKHLFKNLHKGDKDGDVNESIYSNWREEWEFIGEYNIPNYATGDSEKNLENPKPKTQSKSSERITEKNVKNKIVINPPMGMKEAFAEIGGVITEMYEIELDEKIDIEKADMGEVIKDFRKSKAPQFKGKSKEKKQEMAVAAKLATEETEEEKKKREQLEQKTKDHDDKNSGRVAEAYYGGEEQRKKDEKKKKIDAFMDKAMPKRTFDQMGRETDRRTGKLKEGVLSGVLSTIRSKNGMKDIAVKGKDKLQDKKDKSMSEGSENPFQVHFDKDGKEYTSKGSKKEAKRRAKNRAENNKKYDPYKGTDGRD